MHYIEDAEVNLETKDYLNTKTYAKTLKKTIDSLSANRAYTVGLFGGWGTGKSSIINTVKDAYQNNPDVAFVTYDAWQYVNDSFRRMFLLKMQRELKYDKTDLMQKFYVNESQKVDYKYVLSLKKLLGITLILLAVAIILIFTDLVNYTTKIQLVAIFSIVNFTILIISRAFEKFDISITKPYLFAPEQFEECFNEILDVCFSSGPITKAMKFLHVGNASVRCLKKLVIVFDNIDRCHHDLAYSLLTDIKTFLTPTNKNVIFVIPVDDFALKRNFKSDMCSEDNEKEEFLRKFFNTVIRIKPYAEIDMFEFAKTIAKENNLAFKPDTLYFASSAYSKNPRRIIQLYNNLESEKFNYEDTFAKDYESQICALLIMREDFPDLYSQILRNPQILKVGLPKDDKKMEERQFLRISSPCFRNVPMNDLSKILTNTESFFDSMNPEIKKALDVYDEKYLIDNREKYASNESQIIDYLYHSLDKYVRSNILSAVASSFEFYAKIYEQVGLIKEWRRFDNLFVKIEYARLYGNVAKDDSICRFIDILTLNSPSYPTAQEKFVDYVLESSDVAPEFGDGQYLMCHSEKMLKKLSGKFVFQHHNFKRWTELEPCHFNFLITNDSLLVFINEIRSLDDGDASLSICIMIFSKKDQISEDCYAKFFEKMHSIFKLKIKFENHFKMIQNIVKVIQSKQKNDALNLDDIQKMIQMIDLSFVQAQPLLQGKPLLDYWKKAEVIDVLLNYLYERIRLFGESNITQRIIKSLLANNTSKIISLYNGLVGCKANITISMNDVLAKIDDFSSIESLNILRYAALYQNNRAQDGDDLSRYVFKDSVITKIPLLFNYSVRKEVVDLICELGKLPVYKTIIMDQFSQRDDINIIGDLISLALSDFTPQRIDRYKDNYEFLKFVLKNGSESQQKLVRNVLLDNIHSEKSLMQTFDCIENALSYIKPYIRDEFVAASKGLLPQAEGEKLDRINKFLEALGERVNSSGS